MSFIYCLFLLILDSKTLEPLTGVEIVDNKSDISYYSDMNGNINYGGNISDIGINFVSYNDFHIKGDTIFLK